MIEVNDIVAFIAHPSAYLSNMGLKHGSIYRVIKVNRSMDTVSITPLSGSLKQGREYVGVNIEKVQKI